jgi:alkanesulfonate monooxygenase SsuD/methylene tetrahydromethanopterin reductase-like flavin-dependent oxidoreductase (luciferase family)
MKALWRDDVASFDGEHVHIPPSWSWPKPVQKPHPPIYLGGNGPVTMRHAAEWADVWYPTSPANDPNLERSIPQFKQMVADAGRDPDAVRVGLAPAAADAARLEELAANGVDECNVAIMGGDDRELLGNLDALVEARNKALGH